MTWHELTANWDAFFSRLQIHFPRMDRSALPHPPRDSRAFTRQVADMHEISETEARDTLDAFMAQQDLARRASELESR